MIRYLKHKQIDKKKWDLCIERSVNSLVYGTSWYLDFVSPHWEALVENDYTSVLPLTGKRKYGITYLAQPFFAQQLGVFSKKNLTAEKILLFIKAIPERFKYVDINLNYRNTFKLPGIRTEKRLNYQICLNQGYDKLYNKYSANNKRNIRKACEKTLFLKKITNAEDILKLKWQNLNLHLHSYHRRILSKLIMYSLEHQYGEIYGVYDDKNELVASAFFLFSGKRLIYLLSVSSETGKENRAMFFLIDQIIKKNEGKDKILDFEGSEIPGLEQFFSGFGAVPVDYARLIINNLPRGLKWLKSRT